MTKHPTPRAINEKMDRKIVKKPNPFSIAVWLCAMICVAVSASLTLGPCA